MGARGPAPSSRRVGRGRGQPAAQLQGCGRLLTQRPPPPSPPARGGRSGSAEWRWGTGSSFCGYHRHLRVFGAGRRGSSAAAARAGSSPETVLSSLLCSPPPGAARPLRPPRAARAREGEGRGGGGRERPGIDTHPKESPGSLRPGARGAPRPGPRSSRGRKGLRRGRGGGVAGVGLGVPELSCEARRLQFQFLLPRAPRAQRCTLGPVAVEPARSLGEEDTPALVVKTFPADSVVAAVAGSRATTSLPAPCALPGIGTQQESKFVGIFPLLLRSPPYRDGQPRGGLRG